ncbi:MAG: acyl-CoA thioesterase [Bdellovibrionales bacterium]
MADLTPVPVSQSKVIMTELVLPQHTNALDSIFGGVIMSWIDIAAAICSQRHSSSQVVTASIDALNFVQPVYKGWIVNIKAAVNFVSKTSMEIGVRVDAENPITKAVFHTASAYLTFVAIGKDGKPVSVPQVIPQTPEEIRRHAAGKLRRQHRLEQRQLYSK